MHKILVPTDFSANSKAGIRFSIQWSAQQKSALVFIYISHTIRLPQWTEPEFKKYADNEEIIFADKLERFVRGMYKSMRIRPGKYSCVVQQGISADIAIMDYCRKRSDIDFISMSTSGAGGLNKLFGTHTGNLITKSRVPVIAVPKHYRRKPIAKLLYATDFHNYKKELKKVIAFAKPLKAKMEVLHLTAMNEVLPDKEIFEKELSKTFRYRMMLHIKKTRLAHSLPDELQKQARISKPSLMVMFTDQHRSLFQKLFFPSKAEELSFNTNIPLLAFHKE